MKLILTLPTVFLLGLTLANSCVTKPNIHGQSKFYLTNDDVYYKILLGDVTFESTNGLCLCYAEKIYHDLKATPPIGALMFIWLVSFTVAMITRTVVTGTAVNNVLDNFTLIIFSILASAVHNGIIIQGGAAAALFFTTSVLAALLCLVLYVAYMITNFGTFTGICYMIFHFIYACYVGPVTYCFKYLHAPELEYTMATTGCEERASVSCNKGLFWFAVASLFPNEVTCSPTEDVALTTTSLLCLTVIFVMAFQRLPLIKQTVLAIMFFLPVALLTYDYTISRSSIDGILLTMFQLAPIIVHNSGHTILNPTTVMPLLCVFFYPTVNACALYVIKSILLIMLAMLLRPLMHSNHTAAWQAITMYVLGIMLVSTIRFPSAYIDNYNCWEFALNKVHSYIYPEPTLIVKMQGWLLGDNQSNTVLLYDHAIEFFMFVIYESVVQRTRQLDGLPMKLQCTKDFIMYLMIGINLQFVFAAALLYVVHRQKLRRTSLTFLLVPIWYSTLCSTSALMRALPLYVMFNTTTELTMCMLYSVLSFTWPANEGTATYCLIEMCFFMCDHSMAPYICAFSPIYITSVIRRLTAWTANRTIAEVLRGLVDPAAITTEVFNHIPGPTHRYNVLLTSVHGLTFRGRNYLFDVARSIVLTPTIRACGALLTHDGTVVNRKHILKNIQLPAFRLSVPSFTKNNLWCFSNTATIVVKTAVAIPVSAFKNAVSVFYAPIYDMAYFIGLTITAVLIVINQFFGMTGIFFLTAFSVVANVSADFVMELPPHQDVLASVILVLFCLLMVSKVVSLNLRWKVAMMFVALIVLKLTIYPSFATMRQLALGLTTMYCTVSSTLSSTELPTLVSIAVTNALSTGAMDIVKGSATIFIQLCVATYLPYQLFVRRANGWKILCALLCCTLVLPKLGSKLAWQSYTVSTYITSVYPVDEHTLQWALFLVYEVSLTCIRANSYQSYRMQVVKDIVMFLLMGIDFTFIIGLVLTTLQWPYKASLHSYLCYPILFIGSKSALFRYLPFTCIDHVVTQMKYEVANFIMVFTNVNGLCLPMIVEVVFMQLTTGLTPYAYAYDTTTVTSQLRQLFTNVQRRVPLTLRSLLNPGALNYVVYTGHDLDFQISNDVVFTTVQGVEFTHVTQLDVSPGTQTTTTIEQHQPTVNNTWCATTSARLQIVMNHNINNHELSRIARVITLKTWDLAKILAHIIMAILVVVSNTTTRCVTSLLILYALLANNITEARTIFDDVVQPQSDYTTLVIYVVILAVLIAIYMGHTLKAAMYKPLSSVTSLLTIIVTALLPQYAPWPALLLSVIYNVASHYAGFEPGTDLIRTMGLSAFLHCAQYLITTLITTPLVTITAIYTLFDLMVAGGLFLVVVGLTALVDIYTCGYFSPREVVVRDLATNKVVSRTYTDTLLGKIFFGDTLMIHANALRMCSANMEELINVDVLLKKWCASNDDNYTKSAKILLNNAHKIGLLDEVLDGLDSQTNIPAVVYSGKSKASIPFNALGVVNVIDANDQQVPVANAALISIRGVSFVLCNYHSVLTDGKPSPKIYFMSRNVFSGNKSGVPAFLKTHNAETDVALYKISVDRNMPHFKVGALKLGQDHLWAGVNPPFTNIDDYFCVPTRPGAYGTTEHKGTPGDSGSFLINPNNGRLCGIKFATAVEEKNGAHEFLPVNYFLNLKQLTDKNIPSSMEAVSAAELTSIPIEELLGMEDHEDFLKHFVSNGNNATSEFDTALATQDPDEITKAIRNLQKVVTIGKARSNHLLAKRQVQKAKAKIDQIKNSGKFTETQLERNRIDVAIKLIQARIAMLGSDNPDIATMRAEELDLATKLQEVSKRLRELVKQEHAKDIKELTDQLTDLSIKKAHVKAKMLPDEDGVVSAKIAEYRQQQKDLNTEMDKLVSKLAEYQDSFQALQTRMPGAIKAIRYPIVYNDGDQWVAVLSESKTVRTDSHPAVEQTVLAVGRDYGYPKQKLWRKILQANTTTKEWASEYLFNAGNKAVETSLVSFVRQFLWPGQNTYEANCPNCARLFTCSHQSGTHNCDTACLNSILNDIHRHLRNCRANISNHSTRTFVINNVVVEFAANSIGINGKWCRCDQCIKTTTWFESAKANDAKFKANRYIVIYNSNGNPECYVSQDCYDNLLVQQIHNAKTTSGPVPSVDLIAIEARMEEFFSTTVTALHQHTDLLKKHSDILEVQNTDMVDLNDQVNAMSNVLNKHSEKHKHTERLEQIVADLQSYVAKNPPQRVKYAEDYTTDASDTDKPKYRRRRNKNRKADLEWDTSDLTDKEKESYCEKLVEQTDPFRYQTLDSAGQPHPGMLKPLPQRPPRPSTPQAKKTSSPWEGEENVQVVLGLPRHADYSDKDGCNCPFHRGCNRRGMDTHDCQTCHGFCIWCNDTQESCGHVTLDCPDIKIKKVPCCGVTNETWFNTIQTKGSTSQCTSCDNTEMMCVFCFQTGHMAMSCPLLIRRNLAVEWRKKKRDTPLYSNEVWLQSVSVPPSERYSPKQVSKPMVFQRAPLETEPEGI